jgi:hypothetical protein
MIVDCDTCAVRGNACRECVVSVVLGGPVDLQLGIPEQRAIDVLSDAGLVPKLRLVPVHDQQRRSA